MELFVDNNAPNARRVLMFVAEKNIDLSVIEVCVDEGEHRTPEFLAMNPLGQVPVLKFPDGTCVSESMAICRYLDETHEGPRLFGDTAERRAVVHMWTRRAEQGVFVPTVEYGHHSHPAFRDHFEQVPEYAALSRAVLEKTYDLLNAQLTESSYVAGKAFSVADIVAYCGAELALLWGVLPGPSLAAFSRWHEEVSERPAARIARYR